jgi:hypothetical protein
MKRAYANQGAKFSKASSLEGAREICKCEGFVKREACTGEEEGCCFFSFLFFLILQNKCFILTEG